MNHLQKATETLNAYEKYGAQGVLDTSLASAVYQNNGAGNANNTSTIEQQLDMKYKQYSTSNSSAMGHPGQTPSKMLFTAGNAVSGQSQFPSHGNLRSSIDGGQLSMADLATANQLSLQNAQLQQFLNMNGTLGAQQNQNLGPTQIFYNSSNSGQPSQQNNSNLLAQLLSQQSQQLASPMGTNQAATQMLLLELLRQSNANINSAQMPLLQQHQHSLLQQQQQVQDANTSMYGQGFHNAQQLLAQSQGGSKSDTKSAVAAKLFTSGLASQGTASEQQKQLLLQSSNAHHQHTSSNNLSNIYQNLNNYQAMIDNLEQQTNGSQQQQHRAATSGAEILNQSRYREYQQLETAKPQVPNTVTFQSASSPEASINQNNPASNVQILSAESTNSQQFQQQQPYVSGRGFMATNTERLDSLPSERRMGGSGTAPLSDRSQERDAGFKAVSASDYVNLADERPLNNANHLKYASRSDRHDTSQNQEDAAVAGADADDVEIMWPSAANNKQPASFSRQNEDGNQQAAPYVNKVTKRTKSGYYRRRNTDSLDDINEEVDDNASGIQYNNRNGNSSKHDLRLSYYNYKEETSSGFERDIHRQSTNEGSKSNRWMRNSQGQFTDIDDIPIPTAEDGPKTFEQLLAEKMEAEQALAEGRQQIASGNGSVPKKEFLKRKKPAYAPPAKPQATKKYRYYSDALGVTKQGSLDSMADQTARNSRRSGQNQRSDERKDRRAIRAPNQMNSARQVSADPMRPVSSQPTSTTAENMSKPEQIARYSDGENGPAKTTTSTTARANPTPPPANRPFLKRGTGTAHLQGRVNSRQKNRSQPHAKQPASGTTTEGTKPPTPRVTRHDEAKATSTTTKEQEIEMTRQIIASQRKRRQDIRYSNEDDSDSNNEGVGSGDHDGYPGQSHRNQAPVRSNFQKASSSAASAVKRQATSDSHDEKLERAIEKYQSETEALMQKRTQYEDLLRKVKLEQREVENTRRRNAEEIERMREEEMNKIRKEKKALEQRQKNFQQNSANTKKEREQRDEIDQLRREINKYKSEAELKAKKQQSQIERLTKLNNELKQKNRELQEELRAADQQRIILERSNPPAPQTSSTGAIRTSGTQQIFQSNIVPSSSNIGRGYGTFAAQQKRMQQARLQSQGNGQAGRDEIGEDEEGAPYEEDGDEIEGDDEVPFDEQDVEYGDGQNNGGGYIQANQVRRSTVCSKEKAAVGDPVMHTAAGQEKYGGNVDSDDGEDIELELQDSVNLHDDLDHNTRSGKHMAGAEENAAAEEEEEEDYSLKYPKEYHNKSVANQKVTEQYVGQDGKIQRIYQNGKKEVIFNNGVKRESFPDGYTIVYFNNEDIKQTFPNGKVVYYFAEAQTTQSTFPDKLQVFKFSNNQIEKHFPDKTKEIIFPDGTIKCIFEDGEEESIFPDGTIQRIEKSGIKAIEFANGQKDILYPDGVRVREFPDGKVRKTHPDGKTEVFQK